MMNKTLKLRIIERFGSQADFAAAIKEHESVVSRVIRDRKNLAEEEKKKWAKALLCTREDIFPDATVSQELTRLSQKRKGRDR